MLSSRAPTVSPKSLRACSRTTVVRKEGWSCDTTGLVASRGRHLIIRSAITLSPHCRRTDTAHTGCTGWNSSCSRQILRLIFCFCAVGVVGTAATVADVTQVDKLLHGDENVVCADAGYTGVEKRSEHADREVIWQVAARRSTYKMLDKRSALYKAKRKIEKAKAQVRAKVEPPFRVIKRQFGYTKVRFRGLVRNTAQLVTLFALSNLWMARRHLLASAGEVRL